MCVHHTLTTWYHTGSRLMMNHLACACGSPLSSKVNPTSVASVGNPVGSTADFCIVGRRTCALAGGVGAWDGCDDL